LPYTAQLPQEIIMAVRHFDAGSPFDFKTQALTFVPNLPFPSGKTAGQWRTQGNAVVNEVVHAAGGSSLLLFTSRTEMEEAYRANNVSFARAGYTVLKQGDRPNKELAKRFSDDVSSVLFGLASFGTGVDFQGETCKFVWINKLPFPVPSDVVLAAKVALADKKYGKWTPKGGFNGITVPQMALDLLQWYGRGVRTVTDRTVIGIGDARLYGKEAKPYGAVILKALPPAPVTADLQRVVNFLKEN
jgi:ATP-dependent DNA helicase DinG